MRKLEKPISGLAIINIKKQEVDYIPEKLNMKVVLQNSYV